MFKAYDESQVLRSFFFWGGGVGLEVIGIGVVLGSASRSLRHIPRFLCCGFRALELRALEFKVFGFRALELRVQGLGCRVLEIRV